MGRVFNTMGYGAIHKGKAGLRRAHRISWEIVNGPVPKGLQILHHCDVRPCVNPDHLSLGDHAANMQDMSRKGRHAVAIGTMVTRFGEDHPSHKLTWDAVHVIRSSDDTDTDLAKQFGVSRITVRNIRSFKKWRGLPKR